MTGIYEANILVEKEKDKGEVLYKGFLSDGVLFIIIKLDNDLGYITQYDHNSDLKIDEVLNVGSRTELIILDEYTAIWRLI